MWSSSPLSQEFAQSVVEEIVEPFFRLRINIRLPTSCPVLGFFPSFLRVISLLPICNTQAPPTRTSPERTRFKEEENFTSPRRLPTC